jgi:hypothetical protein
LLNGFGFGSDGGFGGGCDGGCGGGGAFFVYFGVDKPESFFRGALAGARRLGGILVLTNYLIFNVIFYTF